MCFLIRKFVGCIMLFFGLCKDTCMFTHSALCPQPQRWHHKVVISETIKR